MPRKAVVDSSVLVSAFLGRSSTGTIPVLLDRARNGAFVLCLSPAIVAETTRALLNPRRPRLRHRASPGEVQEFMADLLTIATLVEDLPDISAVPRDPNDDHVIACALKAGARFIITGDNDMLSVGEYQGIRIVTPRQFLDRLT